MFSLHWFQQAFQVFHQIPSYQVIQVLKDYKIMNVIVLTQMQQWWSLPLYSLSSQELLYHQYLILHVYNHVFHLWWIWLHHQLMNPLCHSKSMMEYLFVVSLIVSKINFNLIFTIKPCFNPSPKQVPPSASKSLIALTKMFLFSSEIFWRGWISLATFLNKKFRTFYNSQTACKLLSTYSNFTMPSWLPSSNS